MCGCFLSKRNKKTRKKKKKEIKSTHSLKIKQYKQKELILEPKVFSKSASLAITKIQGEILLRNLRSIPNSELLCCGWQRERFLETTNFDDVLAPALKIFQQNNMQEVHEVTMLSLETSRIICEFAGTELSVQSTGATQRMKEIFHQQITKYYADQQRQFAKGRAERALYFHQNHAYLDNQLRKAEKKRGKHFSFDIFSKGSHIYNGCKDPELVKIYYEELACALKKQFYDFYLRSVRVTERTIYIEFEF
jgi:hypothetical protein